MLLYAHDTGNRMIILANIDASIDANRPAPVAAMNVGTTYTPIIYYYKYFNLNK